MLTQTAALLLLAAVAIGAAVWWTNSRQAVSPEAVDPGRAAGTPPGGMSAQGALDSPHELASAADLAADAPPAEPPPAALEELVASVMPAVVTIQAANSRGSGFFVAPDTILTNVHVVGTNRTVTVRRPDGLTRTARVTSMSPAFDIAVLNVEAPPGQQPSVQLGAVSDIRVGEEVIAIGTPLGFLDNTVSRGIVSGLRSVGGATLVQTDAAINPGNSGGPLLNRKGVVIGIIKSGYLGSDGLAFAVAADHARAVLEGRVAPAVIAADPPPAQVLAPLAPGAIDQRRLEADRSYETAVGELARRADALDGQWKSFAAQCYQGQVAGTFDRPWFALWDAAAMQGVVASGCMAYFNDFRRRAEEIRQAVAALDESARRADVYPGTRRDVLRRYRLDYWSR
jgi:S1-C subfamily serine protease